MGDKPPFDTTKWAFFLVALVLLVYVAIPVVSIAACLVYAREIITSTAIKCDPDNRLPDLLAAALAAALALYTGQTKR